MRKMLLITSCSLPVVTCIVDVSSLAIISSSEGIIDQGKVTFLLWERNYPFEHSFIWESYYQSLETF